MLFSGKAVIVVSMYNSVCAIADTDHDIANKQHQNQSPGQGSSLCIPHPCNVSMMLLSMRQVNQDVVLSKLSFKDTGAFHRYQWSGPRLCGGGAGAAETSRDTSPQACQEPGLAAGCQTSLCGKCPGKALVELVLNSIFTLRASHP